LGVFCRSAPSTKAIIRSMKVWPGSAVMRTTIRSESTRVPPVTAERSPPDSRMTGADSPVMADSSTEATPSTISPSEGMVSPASQITRSPFATAEAGTRSSVPSAPSRRASVVVRILRKVSAWALPRPSATASAKLANQTVRASHTVIDQVKTPGWAIASTRLTTVPMRTTNMTGFLAWARRSTNFRRASRAAWPRICPSRRRRAWATPRGRSGACWAGSGVPCAPVPGSGTAGDAMVIRRTCRG